MKISKNLLAAVAVTTVATGGILGISAASAHGNGENKDELVTKLSENLTWMLQKLKVYLKHNTKNTKPKWKLNVQNNYRV